MKLCKTWRPLERRQVQCRHGAVLEGGINTVLPVQVEVPMLFVTLQRGDFQKCLSRMLLQKEKQAGGAAWGELKTHFCRPMQQGKVNLP